MRGPRGPTMRGSLPRSEADFLMSHMHVHVPNTLLAIGFLPKGKIAHLSSAETWDRLEKDFVSPSNLPDSFLMPSVLQ